MMFTGYGRGWQEPKATTPFARFKQRLREPATMKDWNVGIFLISLVWLCIAIFGGMLMAAGV